jgi:hypothetical protein
LAKNIRVAWSGQRKPSRIPNFLLLPFLVPLRKNRSIMIVRFRRLCQISQNFTDETGIRIPTGWPDEFCEKSPKLETQLLPSKKLPNNLWNFSKKNCPK